MFLSGYLSKPSDYTALMQRLASWGVTTAQPAERGWLSVPQQTALFATAPAWLAAQAVNGSSPLSGRVDAARLAVGGYSRGGKIAAQLCASQADAFAACYLIGALQWGRDSGGGGGVGGPSKRGPGCCIA